MLLANRHVGESGYYCVNVSVGMCGFCVDDRRMKRGFFTLWDPPMGHKRYSLAITHRMARKCIDAGTVGTVSQAKENLHQANIQMAAMRLFPSDEKEDSQKQVDCPYDLACVQIWPYITALLQGAPPKAGLWSRWRVLVTEVKKVVRWQVMAQSRNAGLVNEWWPIGQTVSLTELDGAVGWRAFEESAAEARVRRAKARGFKHPLEHTRMPIGDIPRGFERGGLHEGCHTDVQRYIRQTRPWAHVEIEGAGARFVNNHAVKFSIRAYNNVIRYIAPRCCRTPEETQAWVWRCVFGAPAIRDEPVRVPPREHTLLMAGFREPDGDHIFAVPNSERIAFVHGYTEHDPTSLPIRDIAGDFDVSNGDALVIRDRVHAESELAEESDAGDYLKDFDHIINEYEQDASLHTDRKWKCECGGIMSWRHEQCQSFGCGLWRRAVETPFLNMEFPGRLPYDNDDREDYLQQGGLTFDQHIDQLYLVPEEAEVANRAVNGLWEPTHHGEFMIHRRATNRNRDEALGRGTPQHHDAIRRYTEFAPNRERIAINNEINGLLTEPPENPDDDHEPAGRAVAMAADDRVVNQFEDMDDDYMWEAIEVDPVITAQPAEAGLREAKVARQVLMMKTVCQINDAPSTIVALGGQLIGEKCTMPCSWAKRAIQTPANNVALKCLGGAVNVVNDFVEPPQAEYQLRETATMCRRLQDPESSVQYLLTKNPQAAPGVPHLTHGTGGHRVNMTFADIGMKQTEIQGIALILDRGMQGVSDSDMAIAVKMFPSIGQSVFYADRKSVV